MATPLTRILQKKDVISNAWFKARGPKSATAIIYNVSDHVLCKEIEAGFDNFKDLEVRYGKRLLSFCKGCSATILILGGDHLELDDVLCTTVTNAVFRQLMIRHVVTCTQLDVTLFVNFVIHE